MDTDYDNDSRYEEETKGDDDSNAFRVFVARALGYLVGFGSLMLYTPIAVRISLQKHADGLVMSTWWLKLSSYLLSDAYYVRKRYDLSTYAETVIITIESLVVLALVAWYQQKTREACFWVNLSLLAIGSLCAFTIAPDGVLAAGQLGSVLVNTAALLPQCHHNLSTRTKGDYSPLTATLAAVGCLVRIFTTATLNGSDPVLMVTFFAAFCANFSLLLQILYFGMAVEGLSFWSVFLADVAGSGGSNRSGSDHGNPNHGDLYDAIAEPPPGSGDASTASRPREPAELPSSERVALRRRPAIELAGCGPQAGGSEFSTVVEAGEAEAGYGTENGGSGSSRGSTPYRNAGVLT